MADAELRADSAQVTLTSTLPLNSPSGVATGANGQGPLSECGAGAEALCGLSAPMRRAVANYVKARDYPTWLPADISGDECDRAEAAYIHADNALLNTPAENLMDLRAKFDAIWCDPAATPNDRRVRAIFADFRRLTGGTVSPIFNAEVWLHYFERRGGAYVVRGDEVFLLQPNGANLDDNLFELEALGGKAAVDELIRQRCTRKASHD